MTSQVQATATDHTGVHQLMHRITGQEQPRTSVELERTGRARRLLRAQDWLVALAVETATATSDSSTKPVSCNR